MFINEDIPLMLCPTSFRKCADKPLIINVLSFLLTQAGMSVCYVDDVKQSISQAEIGLWKGRENE